MSDLCEYAYEVLRQSLSLDTLEPWLEFVGAGIGASNGPPGSTPGSGAATPVSPTTPLPSTAPSVFGVYADRMREDLFHFLVVHLPATLGVSSPPSNGAPPTPTSAHEADAGGREALVQVFSRVPFELFKSATESPAFQIGEAPFFILCA